MNNEKVIELVEHKEKQDLTNSEKFFLDLIETLFKYKGYIISFILGFIIGVLI